MLRLVYLAFASWASLFVAVLSEEAREATSTITTVIEAPSTTVEVVRQEVTPTTIPATTSTAIPTTTITVPLPRWEGDIHEEYGDGTGCTQEEANIVARAMWDVGASDSSVEWMLYVISRESTCDSSVHNGDRSTGDDSFGLCQQNNLSGWFDEGALLENYDRFAFASDFALNAESCAVMWAECGKGPWTRGDYGCSTPRELR